jgi:HD-GYP domain-containing protein (c-di-GMP phosphodiesterase class II)
MYTAEGFVSLYDVPLVAKGRVVGVLEIFQRKPLAPDPEWQEFLETLAQQAALAIDDAELFASLQRTNMELTLAYDTTLEGWARALELRDPQTEGHTRRVVQLAEDLGRVMGLSEPELAHLRRGALLHDIGKVGIPDSILHKTGPLDAAEWAVMRRHPAYAHDLLSPIPYLRPALDIPYCHHERWDGTGYPRGLAGEQIPLAARIFAVVDSWDALTSDRPYRPAWSRADTIGYLRQHAGAHFDPQVVAAFLHMLASQAEIPAEAAAEPPSPRAVVGSTPR